ncbi:hypothetical protein K788_0008246 [Paraburkholderia caribensis MBA4]|uniref:Uncharacterized protein n=1 Tax=Paraburkholderia caribensis MBA4 TaxID=1323664 RepID=A0A0P0RES3_9BURK|nr:hypothetical protein K788_0008246 [Paraburkholderia caribensis MBA4]
MHVAFSFFSTSFFVRVVRVACSANARQDDRSPLQSIDVQRVDCGLDVFHTICI